MGGDPTPSLFDPAPRREARRPAARPSLASAPRPAAASDEAGEPQESSTPVMQQYARAKREAGDALLFFRLGDFYELFYEDAKVAARVLGLALTSRGKSIPMAGVPAKAYEGYLQTLLREGFRVALCDQVEDAALAKGLVERRLTRIVTAGTVFEDDLLERGTSNWLLAVLPRGELCGLAWLDVSTGEFVACEIPSERLADEVSRLDPAEILLPETVLEEANSPTAERLRRVSRAPLAAGPAWTFQPQAAREVLQKTLGVATLEGLRLSADGVAAGAAGAALAYVQRTQRGSLPPVSTLSVVDPAARTGLDRATRACLELLATQRDGRREGSLLSVMDGTRTAMGARLLREWLVLPLVDPGAIRERQSAVAELVANTGLHRRLTALLDELPDLERIASRLLAGRGTPRDLAALRRGLAAIPRLQELLSPLASGPLARAAAEAHPLPELLDVLRRGLAEHPAATLGEGGLIAPGWDRDLDELRGLREHGTEALTRFQAEEAARLALPGLKVGFNKVFGYYLEITHAQAAHVEIPESYVRKQTLISAERYVTPELKALETKILTAEERGRVLESELFLALRERAAQDGLPLRALARGLAQVDVLAGFAALARERGWVAPEVDGSDVLEITDGRHPVLDTLLPPGSFVPNDALLDREHARLVLITGPNMAGKSTYIRQVALLVLLAQCGSFVPATRARVGVVDRIFTRVGAADDLSAGASTFMIEMTETAAILHGATERSLVILDEVGRGTSTGDGLSLAWAISEYLVKKVGARTLFATHYHELVDLAEEFACVKNVNVAVREWGDEIVFQHKIVPGGTDRSYGLHVARLAGVPRAVIERAKTILHDLERSAPDLRPGTGTPPAGGSQPEEKQRSLFGKPVAAVVDELLATDPDVTTPQQAHALLRRLRERLQDGAGPGEPPPAGG